MIGSDILRKHEALLVNLRSLVEETEERIIRADPDPLFAKNANFFVKSYLITLCTYLEVFLQEKAFDFVDKVDAKIRAIAVPKNVVRWAVMEDPSSCSLFQFLGRGFWINSLGTQERP